MRKLVILLLVASAATAFAQQGPPRPQKQIDAMAKLAYMTGEWTGTGWMLMRGNKSVFRGTEVVQSKLAGTALLVEGSFFAKPAGSETEIPVHTTLGVITYDPATSKYQFASWLATGTSGQRELIVKDGGWMWEMQSPMGRVRYIFQLTDAGEWLEIGERTSDGTTWEKFFEMTLAKR